jgi:hypothetical protein
LINVFAIQELRFVQKVFTVDYEMNKDKKKKEEQKHFLRIGKYFQ